MNERLEARNIFLDTQVFVDRNFQYVSGHLDEIVKLIMAGQLNLYATDITIREVEAQISEAVKEAKRVINVLRKEGRILWNSTETSFDNIFYFDEKSTRKHLLDQFSQFLDTTQTTIFPTSDVSAKTVFDNYFSGKPPFGVGKKKHEFPDAFALEALMQWCVKNNERIYVISGDGDMASACERNENLLHLDRIEILLDLINKEDEYIALIAKIADTFITENLDTIEQQVTEQFLSLGFWTEEPQGDVDYVEVEDMELLEIHLINTEMIDQQGALLFELQFEISFLADVSYEDFSNAIYDREDDKYYNVKYVSTQFSDLTAIAADIHVLINRQDHSAIELDFVELDRSNEYGIIVSIPEDLFEY